MKKRKYITNSLIVLVLLLISTSMYLFYPSMQKGSQNNSNVSYQISQFASERISSYNYFIDQEFKRDEGKSTDLEQYLDQTGTITEENAILSFSNYLNRYSSEFSNQEDISYTAINKKTNKVKSNTSDNLSQINEDKNLKEKFQWFIQYEFDSQGRMSINYQKNGFDFLEIGKGKTYNSNFFYSYEEGSEFINNPTDLKITYAVSNTLFQDGPLATYLTMSSYNDFIGPSLLYIMITSVFLFVIILLTPFRYLEEARVYRDFAKVKFELLSTLWCVCFFFIYRFVVGLIPITLSGQFLNFLKEYNIPLNNEFIIHVVNIGFWFILFFLITLLLYMIKYLFNKGFIKYFFDNTCLGWIAINSKKLMAKVINFDFEDKINKSVLRIVLLNFVIISIMSMFFVFGIFFAFIYSIIIFILLKNKFEEIKKDYQVLLNSTRKLSEGNFDQPINEDVGIFNPLKNEFSHIKDGFEKAVKEEVKSQKMKTELISNVSHDLKTPLTSIITYIDLLKNDQLSNEDREKYIQILDRNSLRLKNLIDDLFEVSKVNSGDVKLDLIEVDIIALIKQAQFECMDKLEEKNLDIRFSFDQEKIICQLDSSKTYRIFENLFINMSKYALDHTRAYIEVRESPEAIKIIFKNISADEMVFNENDIVERFVQGDKSRNTSGSGLGLAIVKSFTELQKGKFSINIDGDLFKSTIEFRK